jgi:hypothetical protein
MSWWDGYYNTVSTDGYYYIQPTWTSSGEEYIKRPDPEEVMEVLASVAVDIGEVKEDA